MSNPLVNDEFALEFLKVLADGKTRFGKEIADAMGQQAHPWFSLTVNYIALARLERMGLITGIDSRRKYMITKKGLELINESLPLP